MKVFDGSAPNFTEMSGQVEKVVAVWPIGRKSTQDYLTVKASTVKNFTENKNYDTDVFKYRGPTGTSLVFILAFGGKSRCNYVSW